MKTLPQLSLQKTDSTIDFAEIKKQNFTDVESIVRYIFKLFAQTQDYKNIDSDYRKTAGIIDQIKKDLQKELGRYDPDIVNKQTKSYYDDLEKFTCTEIYKLCDFVMKSTTTWERDYKRSTLLFEVLYRYITDRAFCNSRLDCNKVSEILKAHNMEDQWDVIKKAISAVDKRFRGNIVTIRVDTENSNIIFENRESGILDIIPMSEFN